MATLNADETNINLLEVMKGFAWHYKKYSTDKELVNAEELAKMAKMGLW